MVKKKLIIPKKDRIKGECGYKTFSVHIKEPTVQALDDLAKETGCFRNELINIS